MQKHFAMFAAYNRWANERLYAATARLTEAEYRADRGAFFGSLNGTLNHLLVTDRIWMHRFTGAGHQPTRLDEILFDELPSLSEARQAEDARIITYIDGLSQGDLVGTFSYRTITRPADITQPLAPALLHFFNHQTHHRGQAHTLLTIAGGRDAAPSLDLIYFQRETGIGLA
jgi:uncharacterized damage-inducible protein DinB